MKLTPERLAANNIDAQFTHRLAIVLECMILNPTRFYDEACALLDEYKSAWEEVNPSPPTFMGEPVVRRERERASGICMARAAKMEAEAQRAIDNGVLVPAPKLEEMQAEIRALRKQLENSERVARHEHIVAESAIKQLAEAQAKLAHLAKYWNRDENEIAMKDACWHTVEVAEASDTSALDAAISAIIAPYKRNAERYCWLRENCLRAVTIAADAIAITDSTIDAAIAAKGVANE